MVAKELDVITKDVGRYHIGWMYKTGTSGHIITCERLPNGNTQLYDPQTGKIRYWKNDIEKLADISIGIDVLRVDNLLVNTKIVHGVVVKL